MSNPDAVQLIAQLRLTAPFSEDGYMMMRAANAIEDAEARVALAHADALNEAAKALDADGWAELFSASAWAVCEWLQKRARAIEVGAI